jgi:hypothetical protein
MTTTETRCEKTDLYTSQCFHCRSAAAPTIDSQMGKWFHANYDGTCSVCGEAFEEGDEIRADGSGGWQGRYCCAEED